MSPASRLRLDRSTNLPSIHSFGELSDFLRLAVADEDSRQLSESMTHMAAHIEAIVAALQLHPRRDVIAPMLVDLLTVVRTHRNLVVELGRAWRELYEYAAYLQALNNFRVLLGQWLLDAAPKNAELRVSAEDFQLVAWRTLGEGLLLVDMYEQWTDRESGEDTQPMGIQGAEEPQVQRAMQWWRKLRL